MAMERRDWIMLAGVVVVFLGWQGIAILSKTQSGSQSFATETIYITGDKEGPSTQGVKQPSVVNYNLDYDGYGGSPTVRRLLSEPTNYHRKRVSVTGYVYRFDGASALLVDRQFDTLGIELDLTSASENLRRRLINQCTNLSRSCRITFNGVFRNGSTLALMVE